MSMVYMDSVSMALNASMECDRGLYAKIINLRQQFLHWILLRRVTAHQTIQKTKFFYPETRKSFKRPHFAIQT